MSRIDFLRGAAGALAGIAAGQSIELLEGLPAAGVLDAADVTWTPVGTQSWVFLNGGTLDLGIVRESVDEWFGEHKVYAETGQAFAQLGPVWVSAA